MAFPLETLKDRLKPDCRLLDGENLLLAGHFAPQVDLLVHQAELGTLGLIKVLQTDTLRTEVPQAVSNANYLRHLLMETHQHAANPEKARYTHVELVLVVPEGKAETIANQLSKISQTTQYFHHVGVNLLLLDKDHEMQNFNRAFCWLLRESRGWYQTMIDTKQLAKKPGRLVSLRKKHYRLAGERTYTFCAKNRVHLLHGANGTGKTSLVEALELNLTGRCGRLKNQPVGEYRQIICRKGVDPKEMTLTLTLQLQDKAEYSFEDEPILDKCSTGTQCNSHAFMLNQSLMHDLVMSNDSDRLKIFFETWFPNEFTHFNQLEAAATALTRAWEEMGAGLQQELLTLLGIPKSTEINHTLAFPWLSPDGKDGLNQTMSQTERGLFEKLDPAQLAALAPELEPPPSEADLQTITAFYEALEHALKPRLAQKDQIQPAIDLLARYQDWRLNKGSDQGHRPWPQRLNSWLRAHARAALLADQYRLAQTLNLAKKRGESLDEFPKWQGSLSDLKKTVETARARADQLAADIRQGPGPPGRKPTAKALKPPTPEERNLLNAMAPDIADLGDLLYKAMAQNEPAATVDFQDNWAKKPLQILQTRLAALSQYQPPKKRFEDLTRYWQATLTLNKAKKAMAKTFLSKLQKGGLNKVLNELMALFTPGRWAYNDLPFNLKKDTLALGDDHAELRLNTAELNTFVLALFLLLGPRHSLLLILDDPLQNMDELTVTTVSRGLARLLALLPKKMQLMLLFHGEDNLLRFQAEVPAAVYRLPWLDHKNTSNTNAQKKIQSQAGIDETYEDIYTLIPGLRPPK